MSGFIMPSVKPCVEKLIDPLLKHLSYIMCVGRHVKSMEDDVKRLKDKKKDVKEEIQNAERAEKEATNEVRGWLETVEKLEEDANSISNKYRNRNCFLNCCIGADAVEVKEKVVEEMGRRDGYKEITKEVPSPVAQPVPVTTLPEVSRSQIESKLDEALNFLKSDGESIFGIWGMGGVGKTTLLKQINNALAQDPSFGFDRVILVTASREWTVEKMQKLISEELKLPEGGNIFNYLNNRSFVILLDDLWRRMDLEELGIPPLGMEGTCRRKLILTTRSQQVCNYMEARLTIKVPCLSCEVARLLFREKVGEETIKSHSLILDLADQVADECDGLPLALICIARAMAGQRRVNLWEKAIEDLKRSKHSTIPGMEDPLPLLKFSYDYLNNPSIQECLLLCALWPEDYEIPRDELIECWMGHGLLGEFDTIDEAYNKGDEIIDVLEKVSLLELAEPNFYFFSNLCQTESSVKLHDLIRDMALWIARESGKNEKKWIVLDRAPQDEKSWREAHKMSLMGRGITTLPSNMGGASNLITLILPKNNLSHRELGILQNLHLLKYLDLSHNFQILYFPTEICQLFKLEYLNLSYTNIRNLPDELQDLKNLKYLLLQFTNITDISHQLLSSLVSLENLNLFHFYHDISHSLIIDNLDCMQGRLKSLGINSSAMSDLSKLAQLSSTMRIRDLHIKIDTEDWTSLHVFPPYDLSKVHTLTMSSSKYSNDVTEKLVMEGNHLLFLKSLHISYFNRLKEIIWQRVEQRDVISSALRSVFICGCRELKHVSWLAYLPVIEHVMLLQCHKLKHVVCREEEATTSVEMEGENKHIFPALKFLFLIDLPSLETICDQAVIFPSLEILRAEACPMLKKLPFDSPTSCSKLGKIFYDRPEWLDSLEMADEVKASLGPSFQFVHARR